MEYRSKARLHLHLQLTPRFRSVKKTTVTIFWPNTGFLDIEEVRFCRSFCRSRSHSLCLDDNVNAVWLDYTPQSSMASLLSRAESDFLLVVTDPEILLSSKALIPLVQDDLNDFSALGPIYNLTQYPQQQADLSAPYLNIATLNEMVSEIFNFAGQKSVSVDTLDPSIISYPAAFLQKFSESELKLAPAEFSMLEFAKKIKKNSLVHRFGDYYDGERPDLVEMIPEMVRKILDVGCAMGGYGRGLKKSRPDIWVTGVEMNPVMAKRAKVYYDHIVEGKIEDTAFEDDFDLINCGDVMEHLYDPWNMLHQLGKLLRKGGYLVLSVPNAGHWTIIRDLLNQEFEYVPVGLLCITHIRWFTENAIKKALADSGFQIDLIKKQQLSPTGSGQKFIQTMVDSGYGNEQSLLTNEFIIRAIKK